MEIDATPEQQFIIMLQERINKLEDELLCLERQLQFLNASQYYRIDIELPFQEEDNIQVKKEDILNHIFKYRKQMEPVFAGWTWHLSHNKLIITMVLTTKYPITREQIKKYIEHPHLTVSSFNDLYTFIQFFKYYYHDEDEGDTLYNYEYWHSHYGYLYNLIEYEFTDEPFIKSTNYNASKELQYYLRKWIFHSKNNWVDILRLFL